MTVGRTKWRCSSLWPGSAAQENIHIQSEYQEYVYNQDTLVLRLERQYRCSRRRTVSHSLPRHTKSSCEPPRSICSTAGLRPDDIHGH
jgi:hypothetical protein